MILVDTGPLVALLSAQDNQHHRCKRTVQTIREPLLTVWPAITEAMYLLNPSWKAQDALWEMLEAGHLEILMLEADDFSRMRALMSKYRNLPMDLADAALVCMAEKRKISRIFTLDRRDFAVYRPRGIGRFSILPS